VNLVEVNDKETFIAKKDETSSLKGRKRPRELTLVQGHNDQLQRDTLKEIRIQPLRNATKATKSHKVTPHQPT